MIKLPHKIRLYLGALVVVGLGLYVVLEFTGWQKLEAVTLDGEPVDARFGFDPSMHLLDLPLDSIAADLLKDKMTARVDLSFGFPHRLEVETNRFEPVCLLLEQNTGQLRGLTNDGRLVVLRPDFEKWDSPVITGTAKGRLYTMTGDARLVQLLPQLTDLADDNLHLFRLIDEIDLSNPDYVTVTLSGLSFRVRMTVDNFRSQMDEFVTFLRKYQPDISTTRRLDLRFANMVIQKAKRN